MRLRRGELSKIKITRTVPPAGADWNLPQAHGFHESQDGKPIIPHRADLRTAVANQIRAKITDGQLQMPVTDQASCKWRHILPTSEDSQCLRPGDKPLTQSGQQHTNSRQAPRAEPVLRESGFRFQGLFI